MIRFVLVLAACVATLVFGLALAGVSGPAGTVIAVAGIIGLAALLIFAYVKAWRNDQGVFLTPGKGYREWRAERDKEARERSDASR